jgi:curved DNA-binding protein CbpA
LLTSLRIALLWHPDRNPGKEDAAKEKFLVIQAAHEILSDPATKSKFDAYRQRTARYPAASGVKGNPWQYTTQDVNQRYGAPPKRPPMPTRPAAPTATSTHSWSWARNPPQSAKSKMESARASTEAWNRARPAPKPPQPGTASAGGTTRPSQYREPPPTPRSAAQARRQEAAFGTRRTGYAPASPVGDEPPVKNQHYNTSAGTNPGASAAQTGNPRPASVYPDPYPATAGYSETFLDSRQRTPYAANVGEKTNPFEPLNVNRAKSMRDPTKKDYETPPPPPPRPRSASVGSDNFKRSTNDKPAFDGSGANPPSQFQSRASARYSPRGAETNSAPQTATFPTAGPGSSSSSVNSSTNGTSRGRHSSVGAC